MGFADPYPQTSSTAWYGSAPYRVIVITDSTSGCPCCGNGAPQVPVWVVQDYSRLELPPLRESRREQLARWSREVVRSRAQEAHRRATDPCPGRPRPNHFQRRVAALANRYRVRSP